MNYLAQGRSEEDKARYLQPFEESLVVTGGQKPFEEDEERRRKVISSVLDEVKSLGEGTDRGTLDKVSTYMPLYRSRN